MRLQWAAVHPETLIRDEAVKKYTLHEFPTRNAQSNSGRTSRINRGHFMAGIESANACDLYSG